MLNYPHPNNIHDLGYSEPVSRYTQPKQNSLTAGIEVTHNKVEYFVIEEKGEILIQYLHDNDGKQTHDLTPRLPICIVNAIIMKAKYQ